MARDGGRRRGLRVPPDAPVSEGVSFPRVPRPAHRTSDALGFTAPAQSFMIPALVRGAHDDGGGLPIYLRVQLAGPARLRRGPRETPARGAGQEPRSDARIVEEHLPPHPVRPRRLAERD